MRHSGAFGFKECLEKFTLNALIQTSLILTTFLPSFLSSPPPLSCSPPFLSYFFSEFPHLLISFFPVFHFSHLSFYCSSSAASCSSSFLRLSLFYFIFLFCVSDFLMFPLLPPFLYSLLFPPSSLSAIHIPFSSSSPFLFHFFSLHLSYFLPLLISSSLLYSHHLPFYI